MKPEDTHNALLFRLRVFLCFKAREAYRRAPHGQRTRYWRAYLWAKAEAVRAA